MNKLLYRIIFNKARGMLMVVAEITRSCRAGACPSSRVRTPKNALLATLSPISFGVLLTFASVTSAQAAIIADKNAPAKQQAGIINTANGTTQINIRPPSAGGVSRNTFSQFDVDKKGVIINNSRSNVQTQLGGMVAANPNMAKGEARVILNEVNSRDPSQLNGYIEVAGKKAQVIIANPSGITCDGCGFINANRATLTTGKPVFNGDYVSGYQVDGGEISITGDGMDSTRQDYTDIIARSVKVNAGVWANDLKVVTGRNQVDTTNETVVKKRIKRKASLKWRWMCRRWAACMPEKFT
ncbi:MAG: filamentous hemagglutinin N-terminal domain-containing protein [Serratia proteamaculans]